MLKLLSASVLLALLVVFSEHYTGFRITSNKFSRRQAQTPTADIPDYILVSPDNVALAGIAPDGLDANDINNVMCLINRMRYDNKLPALALDAQLVRHAQARAELLSKDKVQVDNNAIVGDIDPLSFNSSVWADVKENIIISTQNPTFAYWQVQQNEAALAQLTNTTFVNFGIGYYNGYYVQALGVPIQAPKVVLPISWCPSNETFWKWVFPNDTPDTPIDSGSGLVGKAFPYEQFADANAFYNPDYPVAKNGLTTDPSYYFTPPEGSVPFLQDLSIIDSVAAGDSEKPYAAIADAGERGMTAAELNLMVCLINARRYESCLPPVALHSQLVAAAQAHSYEINRAQNMSHFGSAGSLSTRVRRRGFNYSGLGENVAYGMLTAYDAHITFSQSQMHLNNMLNPSYTFLGAGRSGQYWTVTLGTYMDKGTTPALSSLPLCPGSGIDVGIAFPSGLPDQPKLETTACGGTEAITVTTPPEVQTLLDQLDDEPTSSNQTSDKQEASQSSSSDDQTTSSSDQAKDNQEPSESSSKRPQSSTISDNPSSPVETAYVNIIVETRVVVVTVYVDGDAIANSTSKSDYSPTSLNDDDLDIIVEPEN
ncbi:hypothetical protein GGH96_004733 [Coemansia sp. RSA 1972]|nr:hypothetical protein GGH96_004733 [Coemansia sp. RSA 1972]